MGLRYLGLQFTTPRNKYSKGGLISSLIPWRADNLRVIVAELCMSLGTTRWANLYRQIYKWNRKYRDPT